MLRERAASRLLFSSVAPPGDPRFLEMQYDCYIQVGPDKRARIKKLVDIHETLAVSILVACRRTQSQKDWRLFRAAATTLRTKLQELLKRLKWSHLNFVPHSLRYGGAVYDHHVRGLSIEDVQLRGRWKQLDTCRAYVEKGMSQLFNLDFPKESHQRLALSRQIPDQIIQQVPALFKPSAGEQ